MDPVRIALSKNQFKGKERILVQCGRLTASSFLYESGVHAVRLANEHGHIIVLPYKGQQVWDAYFHGRYLNMDTMYAEPRNVTHFLDTYGCFVMHCGPLRMGCPGPEDNHTLHGDLPYGDYDEAALKVGRDAEGAYMGITGLYDYNRAFGEKYHARPMALLREGSSLVEVSIEIENYSHYPMDLMYMCHVNFRPVEGGRIIQSVGWDKKSMKVRTAIPDHVEASAGFVDFLSRLEADPGLTQTIRAEDEYDPEIAFFVENPRVDAGGWSHYMQVLPDGSADYIRYKPSELDHNTRWISRTQDQKGLGLALPATCDPEGYTAEKLKGNVKTVAGKSSVTFHAVAGYQNREEAAKMEETIKQLMR
ncbi:DUF4432 family protein [Chloroflexota bacterium]